MNYYNELIEYMKTIRPVSTHSHFLADEIFGGGYCLKTVLQQSYNQDLWCGVKLDDTLESRKNYFNLLKNRNCFKWLEKALQQIYHLDVPLREDTYELFDQAVRSLYRNGPKKHLEVLNKYTGYSRIILDAYWNPGDDNGHPDIFAKAFRIDSFFAGIDTQMKDHDGNNCRNLYHEVFDDFDSFFESMYRIIKQQVQGGASALKCAISYERGLNVEQVKESEARMRFQKLPQNRSAADIKVFQDYVFQEACQIAAQLDIPMQIHTGLGRLHRSNAILLQPVIEANPDTKFVLFHGSYPWMDDILGLVEKYPNNVFPDLVWLPLISCEASVRFLSELIEVTNSHSICWGDDTWTPEESFGALLAVRHVLATVLSEKIQTGYLSKRDALEIVSNILCDNAARIYKL